MSNNIFSFVEQGVNKRGTSVESNKRQEYDNDFIVFRKKRFLGWWVGEKSFCVCKEIVSFEDVITCKISDLVVAILPKTEFSCAISTKLIDD